MALYRQVPANHQNLRNSVKMLSIYITSTEKSLAQPTDNNRKCYMKKVVSGPANAWLEKDLISVEVRIMAAMSVSTRETDVSLPGHDVKRLSLAGRAFGA